MREAPEGGALCWPGTDIPKSTNNAFTLGFSNTPHGYVAGAQLPQDKRPPLSARIGRPPKNAFGSENGSIPGLGQNHNIPTFIRRKKA